MKKNPLMKKILIPINSATNSEATGRLGAVAEANPQAI